MKPSAVEGVRNAHAWFEVNSGWAPPTDETLIEWHFAVLNAAVAMSSKLPLVSFAMPSPSGPRKTGH